VVPLSTAVDFFLFSVPARGRASEIEHSNLASGQNGKFQLGQKALRPFSALRRELVGPYRA